VSPEELEAPALVASVSAKPFEYTKPTKAATSINKIVDALKQKRNSKYDSNDSDLSFFWFSS
jgi:hypothetical protein